MARATLRVLSALITGNNPYLVKQQSKVFPISTNLRHYVGRLYFVTTYRFYYKPKLNRTDHVRLFGFRLTIPPGVFHPGLFFSTKIFGTYLLSADFRGKRVLEMGSGSGLLSLIAASRGASVTSTDVNALAVETTRTNADTNGLGNHIRTRGGNLFEGIDQSNLYDYIVWNPPFYPQEPHNEEERAWKAGDSYRVLEQFAKASKRYLARDGRILINLSSHIDNNKILTFFTKEGYTIHQLTHRHSFFEKFVICEIGR
jgi:release factor glutamine methyltransferase